MSLGFIEIDSLFGMLDSRREKMAQRERQNEGYLGHLNKMQVIFMILFGFSAIFLTLSVVPFIPQVYRKDSCLIGLLCGCGVLMLILIKPMKELLKKGREKSALFLKKIAERALFWYVKVLAFLIKPAVLEIIADKKQSKATKRRRTRVLSAKFEWVGIGDKTQDYVGKGAAAISPDGEGDGIFIFLPGKQGRILNLEIRALNGGGVWNTKEGSPNWPVAVINKGTSKRLNLGRKSVDIRTRRNSKFLLFIGNNGEFKPGMEFGLTAVYNKGDSQELSAKIS